MLNIRRYRLAYATVNIGGNSLLVLALLSLATSSSGLGWAWVIGQLGYLGLAVLMLRWSRGRKAPIG